MRAQRVGGGRVAPRQLAELLHVAEGGAGRDADSELLPVDVVAVLDHRLLVPLPLRVPEKPSSQELVDVLRLAVERRRELGLLLVLLVLLPGGGGGLHARPHVHGVLGIQLRLLPQLLHAVNDLLGEVHLLELLVEGEVQHDDALGVGDGVQVRVGDVLDAARQGHLLRVQLIAADGDGALLLELQELLLAEILGRRHNRLHVLAELLAQDLEVERAGQADLGGVLAVVHSHHEELALHVRLQPLQILEEVGVCVDDRHAPQRLLQAHLLLLAAGAPELDEALHPAHGLLHLLVQRLGVEVRDHHPMHGLGLHGVAVGERPRQVLVDHLRDERRQRREQHAEVQQDLVEGAQRRERLVGAQDAAHPVPVQPDVPIREVLEQLGEAADDGVEAVGVHLLAHEADELVERRVDPLVHDVGALLDAARVRLEGGVLGLVPRHLEDEEAVGVVPR
mmetsp:Transcript_70753/g.198464  ORF Transcript_70753/g.198464 Transcript_70753/m.198464 type:complete len:451 (-) Transcript_70753:426-1778(-)